MATVRPDLERMLAHRPGVRKAVRRLAEEVAASARADLATHRVTGDARIEVEHHDTDSIVSLVDKAAMSIEYGRAGYTTPGGRSVGPAEGLFIITKAAHRAG